MAKQFWPKDIQVVTARSPLAVVTEAASQLAEITQGLVEANVRSGATKTGYLVHRLWIEAPTLGYEKAIARLVHEPTPLYPVWAARLKTTPTAYRTANGIVESEVLQEDQVSPIVGVLNALASDGGQLPPGKQLADESALSDWLTEFLGSDKIKVLINGLIATANSSPTASDDDEL